MNDVTAIDREVAVQTTSVQNRKTQNQDSEPAKTETQTAENDILGAYIDVTG